MAYVSNFAIGADGSSDEFRIRSITTNVPEPGTIGLLGLSLLMLRMYRALRTKN